MEIGYGLENFSIDQFCKTNDQETFLVLIDTRNFKWLKREKSSLSY